MAKNQAKIERLLFENYSHSSFTLSFKNNRRYSKKYEDEYENENEDEYEK